MQIVCCDRGHYYDSEEYSTCPQCAREYSRGNRSFENNLTAHNGLQILYSSIPQARLGLHNFCTGLAISFRVERNELKDIHLHTIERTEVGTSCIGTIEKDGTHVYYLGFKGDSDVLGADRICDLVADIEEKAAIRITEHFHEDGSVGSMSENIKTGEAEITEYDRDGNMIHSVIGFIDKEESHPEENMTLDEYMDSIKNRLAGSESKSRESIDGKKTGIETQIHNADSCTDDSIRAAELSQSEAALKKTETKIKMTQRKRHAETKACESNRQPEHDRNNETYIKKGTLRKQKRSLSKADLIITIVVLGLAGLLSLYPFIQNAMYDAKWRDIDPYGENPAAGEMVIAYDKGSEMFTTKFVPEKITANSGKDVGYILIYEEGEKESGAHYQSRPGMLFDMPKYVSGTVDTVSVTLRNYKTGETIAEETLEASPPTVIESSSSSFHVSVPDSRVQEWLEQKLPTK